MKSPTGSTALPMQSGTPPSWRRNKVVDAVLVSRVPVEYSRNPAHLEVGEEEYMAAQVSVLGVQSGMGGLKESQAKFRKHHTEVGDALMNVSGVGTSTGQPVDKDEPRPGYQHQEYPKMLYKPNEETIVKTATEFRSALAGGWRGVGVPGPRRPVPQGGVSRPAGGLLGLGEAVGQRQH